MASLAQLESWVRTGESETQKFKRGTGELKSGMQTLSALLNHRGGRLIFGVDDDGRILGQTVADSTLRDLAQEISRIDPPIQPDIAQVVVAENRQVVIVSIGRGHNRPYAYNGRAYKRVGNTPRPNSPVKNTTASCWRAPTPTTAGKSRPPKAGRLLIWIRPKSPAPSRNRFDEGA